MIHKFDPKNKRKLDSEERRLMMPPYETLEKLGLKQGFDVADIGCGIGYFSIPAADIIGSKSNLYALDISFEMIEEMEERKKHSDMMNIRPVKVEEYDFKLPDKSVDYSIVSNVLHEIYDKERFLEEVLRISRETGSIAIIEWVKGDTGEFGPPQSHRLSEETLIELLISMGLNITKRIDINGFFYGVLVEV